MRRINNAKRKILKTDGKLFAGRQILFMVYEHFRTNKNLGLVYTIFDLARVQWLGDKKLETFRNIWETAIAGMATDFEEAHLTELLLTHMMNSRELKEQVTQFRKRDPVDPERCYQTLIDNIDEHLIYQQELKNRNDQTRTMFGNHVANSNHPAAPVPTVCPHWLAGSCKFGESCKLPPTQERRQRRKE